MREEARRLREDPSAIEDIARRELGLIRPGEKLFILKDIAPPD
ncbi:MAG: septum formation initiator family protein [Vicinamibacterales bacterium]